MILSTSSAAGVHLVAKKDGRQFFVTGHGEYDRDTLANEYFRDVRKGLKPHIPENYFPNDDPSLQPRFTWRSPCASALCQLAELLCLSADPL